MTASQRDKLLLFMRGKRAIVACATSASNRSGGDDTLAVELPAERKARPGFGQRVQRSINLDIKHRGRAGQPGKRK
tara:strand:- start:21310 stop:21537 length:228 start_codon:yes stop_codon:yes gene_type:complete